MGPSYFLAISLISARFPTWMLRTGLPDMPRPLFISLDGLDGTGKSTQCRLLADWLRKQGQEVVESTDPGGTSVGEAIREILLGQREQSRQGASMSLACEALLFMAS